MTFLKANLKKDTRKRPLVTGNRHFCVTPVFAHKPLPEKWKKWSDNLINMGQGVQFENLIKENDYKYSSFYETFITKRLVSRQKLFNNHYPADGLRNEKTNFGAIINRRKTAQPNSIIQKIVGNTKIYKSEACHWGLNKGSVAIV